MVKTVRRRRKRTKTRLPERNEAVEAMEDASVEVEYVYAPVEQLLKDNSLVEEFGQIFEKFAPKEILEEGEGTDQAKEQAKDESDSEAEGGEQGQPEVLSKKKLKKLNRISIAQLKQLVKRPEIVDWEDTTAKDPKFLVFLKSVRNTVPVPSHWSQKRKYLSGKRGFVKPPFELPSYIVDTGIMESRNPQREDSLRFKTKMRNKMHPKLGKLSVDYEKLHNAFFKYQTKPRLTLHGDLYHEGKEFETTLKLKRPGVLSEELRMCLAMPANAPPPWLINMQRYGPPPSYPNLRIPGLNAPIPEGASWGYQPGGWGKPPVDENNRPLYGDVFATGGFQPTQYMEVDRAVWGELEEAKELHLEPDDETDDEEKPPEPSSAAIQNTAEEEEEETAEGEEKVEEIAQFELPETVELRKEKRKGDASLYKVLPQKAAKITGIMGTQFTYDVLQADAAEKLEDKEEITEADLATTKSEAKKAIKLEREDLSDLVAQNAAKIERKIEKRKTAEKNKKGKEFKF